MILQSLNAYYERLRSDDEPVVPPLGFAWRPVSFALLLDENGRLVQVQDLREQVKSKLVPKQMIVPSLGKKKASGIDPDFLWGTTGYVLGAEIDEKPMRTADKFKQFKKLQHSLGDGLADKGVAAVLNFLDGWDATEAPKYDGWNELAGSNVVFRLDTKLQYVHEALCVQNAWTEFYRHDEVGGVRMCLISGQEKQISFLHPGVKGIDGTSTAEAALVSFNNNSSHSYGKDQNLNAPVGKVEAFNYTTALNYLLMRDNRQRVKIGETITVFWTARASPIEGFMGMILNPQEDTSDINQIHLFMEAIRDGKMPREFGDPEVPFFILGLSPSAARISVRFWHVSTVGDMLEKIGQHFRDLSIIKRYESDHDFPTLRQILLETFINHKSKTKPNWDNVKPLLAGVLMRSILTGSAYPQNLLSAVIGRIRADQEVNYLRAAIIKACLIRKCRTQNLQEEVTMSLNKESTNIAYRLGCLFAVLEKAQQEAAAPTKLNTTIKDRFYGSASATPSVVFPLLLRLAQHHIQKAVYGGRMDKMIEEIMCGIEKFPAHLSLDDQGMFAIGYYHQRQAFYVKSENQKEGE